MGLPSQILFIGDFCRRVSPRPVITEQRREYENDHATDKEEKPVFSKRDPEHSVTQMSAVQPTRFNDDRPKDPDQHSDQTNTACRS